MSNRRTSKGRAARARGTLLNSAVHLFCGLAVRAVRSFLSRFSPGAPAWS
jgi:hypothetical protein